MANQYAPRLQNVSIPILSLPEQYGIFSHSIIKVLAGSKLDHCLDETYIDEVKNPPVTHPDDRTITAAALNGKLYKTTHEVDVYPGSRRQNLHAVMIISHHVAQHYKTSIPSDTVMARTAMTLLRGGLGQGTTKRMIALGNEFRAFKFGKNEDFEAGINRFMELHERVTVAGQTDPDLASLSRFSSARHIFVQGLPVLLAPSVQDLERRSTITTMVELYDDARDLYDNYQKMEARRRAEAAEDAVVVAPALEVNQNIPAADPMMMEIVNFVRQQQRNNNNIRRQRNDRVPQRLNNRRGRMRFQPFNRPQRPPQGARAPPGEAVMQQPAQPQNQGPNELICFRCNGVGHLARDCATPADQVHNHAHIGMDVDDDSEYEEDGNLDQGGGPHQADF